MPPHGGQCAIILAHDAIALLERCLVIAAGSALVEEVNEGFWTSIGIDARCLEHLDAPVIIKFTGLRDGEKLYEEVLTETEQTKPTVHPKIKVASVREYQYDEALKNEEELHELSFTYDDMKIVKKMKEIVPEYKSRQSKYEALD